MELKTAPRPEAGIANVGALERAECRDCRTTRYNHGVIATWWPVPLIQYRNVVVFVKSFNGANPLRPRSRHGWVAVLRSHTAAGHPRTAEDI